MMSRLGSQNIVNRSILAFLLFLKYFACWLASFLDVCLALALWLSKGDIWGWG